MKIIFDTNIIYGDFFLRRTQLESVCSTAVSCGIDVMVPAVVVDEFVNQYKEEAEKIPAEIEKLSKKIRLVDPDRKIPNIIDNNEIDVLTKNYRSILETRLKELNIKIIPYPVISHQQVVARDLQRRRPFQNSGKGYRDTLIWESVLSQAKPSDKFFTDPQIIFINKNTKDFFEGNTLHSHLADDLKNIGISDNDFKIFDDLSKVAKEYISPRQEQQKQLLEKKRHATYIGTTDLRQFLIDNISNEIISFISNFENDYYFAVFGPLENPELREIIDVEYVISDIRLLPDGNFIVQVDAKAEAFIDAFLYKGDYFIYENRSFTIVDEDWNRHYAHVEEMIDFPVNVHMMVNPEFDKILSCEVIIDKEKMVENNAPS